MRSRSWPSRRPRARHHRRSRCSRATRTSGLVQRLPDLFLDWQRWGVEVLDSHVAYPLLGYFRSSHDNLSWISAVGTMLDAASLVLTTIEGIPRGEAKLFKRVGTHLVEDIHNFGFRAGEGTSLDRADFDAACDRLEAAGYTVLPRDAAWPAFQGARATYAARLEGHGALLGHPRDVMAGRSAHAPPAHAPDGRPVAHRERGSPRQVAWHRQRQLQVEPPKSTSLVFTVPAVRPGAVW